MKLRVLVGHDYYQHPGGEDLSVAAEVALLRGHGHEVIEYFRYNEEIKGYGVLKMMHLYAATSWSRKSYKEVRELCRKHKPDVASFHNTLPLISPSAYYACKVEGVPIVQTLRNYRFVCPGGMLMRDGRVCEECIGGDFRPSLKHKCFRNSYIQTRAVVRMLRKHWKKGTYTKVIDKYIALTEFAREKFVEAGLSREKIVIKPNFLMDPPEANFGGDYAVFVGRVSPEKGVHILLEAWRHLEFPLMIAGEGPQRKELEAMAIPGVSFLGQVSAGEVLGLLSKARFLVFSSVWYETFGRSMIEAFACGKPVVASRLGTATEIVEEGRTGLLFEPGNAEDLAAKAKVLIDNPALAGEFGRNARVEFEAKYSAEVNYRQLIEIYDSVASSSTEQKMS